MLDLEKNQSLPLRKDAAEAEEQTRREPGLDFQEVPRTASGRLRIEDASYYLSLCDSNPEPVSGAYEFTSINRADQNNASNKSGGQIDGSDGGDADDDDGSDDQNMGDGASNDEDYGDWGRDYYDGYGEGSSGSWQPNIGGVIARVLVENTVLSLLSLRKGWPRYRSSD